MEGIKLISITEKDRDGIIAILEQADCQVFDNDFEDDDPERLKSNYFIVKLDDDIDDVFYDHSEAFTKIFEQFGCICTGFQYNNDYADKNDVNTYYGIWFEKLTIDIPLQTIRSNSS